MELTRSMAFSALPPEDQNQIDRILARCEQVLLAGESLRKEELPPGGWAPAALAVFHEELARLERETRKEWYYSAGAKDEPPTGPHSLHRLRELASSWQLLPTYQVWHPDTQQWESASVLFPANRYTVAGREWRGFLGQGGMGVVHRSQNTDLDREEAVKMIRADLAGAEAVSQFQHEARVVALLQHPNIVQVYHSGKHQGQFFMCLEYVKGSTLRKELPQYRLPAPDPQASSDRRSRRRARAFRTAQARKIAELLEKVARGVHHAHLRGVVHQDLKPENILLAGGEPKVVDFGLARRVDTSAGCTPIGGTPRYMAPEQAELFLKREDPNPETIRRLQERITLPTDVYALGVILYECLTGQPTFRASTVEDTLARVRTEQPEAPSQRNPFTPRDLGAICLKCLQKDPEKRYASAGELADDLHRFRNNQPIRARWVKPWERLTLFCRRSPVVAGLLGFVLFVLGLLAGGWWYIDRERDRANRRADEAEARDQAKTALAHLADGRAVPLRVRALAQGAGTQAPWPAVQREVAQFSELRGKFQEALGRRDEAFRRLGLPPDGLLNRAPEEWDEWAIEIRNGITPWLTTIRLRRGDSLSLPEGPDHTLPPAVAVRQDGKQVAVVYPGSTAVWLLEPGSDKGHRLEIPGGVAELAVNRRVEVANSLGRSRHTTNTQARPSRLAYAPQNRLEYQVDGALVRWNLDSGKRDLDLLKSHRRPQPLSGWLHSSSPRGVASVDRSATAVVFQGWARAARPVEVWRARGGDPAEGGERISQIGFAPDGRALYVQTNARLAVVDVAGGAAAAVPLGDQFEGRVMAPWAGGVALLERSRREEGKRPAQLVFWQATLPRSVVRAARFAEQPQSASLAGDGLLVTGTADGLVHARVGLERRWEVGVPYLGQRLGEQARGRLGGILPPGVTGQVRSLRQSGAGRTVVQDRLAGPEPYLGWGFLPGGSSFLVRQLRPVSDTLRPSTGLYSPRDARPEYTFPTRGKGRLVALGQDARLAAIVADESEAGLSLDIVRLADRKPLRPIAIRPRLPFRTRTRVNILSTAPGISYLLLATAIPRGDAEVELWRVREGPGTVERVGVVPLPDIPTAAFLTPNRNRAIVWRPRNTGSGGIFARIIDLEDPTSVRDLEGFSTIPNIPDWLITRTHFIFAHRQGLTEDPNDAFRVSLWDLERGSLRSLNLLWDGGDVPEMELSPDGRWLAIAGRLQSGMGSAVLCDLRGGKFRAEPYKPPVVPRIVGVAEDYCVLAVDARTTRRLRWTGGSIPSGTRPDAEVVGVQRNLTGETGWLLWRGLRGLELQNGFGAKRVPLENTGELTGRRNILWPGLKGGVLALKGDLDGLWNTRTGKQVKLFPKGHRCFGFDDEHRFALTLEEGKGEIRIWDTTSGKERFRCRPRGPQGPAFDLRRSPWELSPGGDRLIVVSQGVLQLWDLTTGHRAGIVPRPGQVSPVRCVVQHAGAGLVASAGDDGVVLLHSRTDGNTVQTIFAHTGAITALAFSPDGKHLASASANGALALYARNGKNVWFSPPARGDHVTCLAFHPTDPVLLAGTQAGGLRFLNTGTGKLKGEYAVKGGAILSLSLWSPTRLLAVGTAGGQVEVRKEGGSTPLWSWQSGSPVTALTFIGGERMLASGGDAIRFWDTQTKRQVWKLDVPSGPVRTLAMNERAGDLAVLAQGPDVLLFSLPDLNARLGKLALGIPGLMERAWPQPGVAKEPTPPTVADWQRQAEEYARQRRWDSVLWATSKGLELNDRNLRFWHLQAEAGQQLREWDIARAAQARTRLAEDGKE